jgi:hypothetical protein
MRAGIEAVTDEARSQSFVEAGEGVLGGGDLVWQKPARREGRLITSKGWSSCRCQKYKLSLAVSQRNQRRLGKAAK